MNDARGARTEWLWVAAWVIAAAAALAAVLTLVVVFTAGGASEGEPQVFGTPSGGVSEAPLLAPLAPATWMEMLDGPEDTGALLIACEDANADGRLDATDDPSYEGLDIPLPDGSAACAQAGKHAEYYSGPRYGSGALTCDGSSPVLVVLVGGGGTNLVDTSLGESIGMIETANEIQARLADANVPVAPVLTAAAITGADLPQTRMEAWLAHSLARRLDATPCLRAAVLGHSHGGVTVTSVLAEIERAYPGRLYGVLLDRSVALYDRVPDEFPAETPVLNVFQENEGWHGIPLGLPNVEDLDQSAALPAWPLGEGDHGPPAPPVTHLNLDDAPGVRGEIVERVVTWAVAARP